MIEFYSSHIQDDQARKSAYLIAAVIAKALDDLRKAPTCEERKKHINLDVHAAKSVVFFNSETFKFYASLIGINPHLFLEQLIGGKVDPNNKRFTEKDYRVVRARLRWNTMPVNLLLQTDDELEDEPELG